MPKRRSPFRELVVACAAVEDERLDGTFDIDGSVPPGRDAPPGPAGMDRVQTALARFEEGLPLVKDVEGGTWESVTLSSYGTGSWYLHVRNLVGRKEGVTTWIVARDFEEAIRAWSECRLHVEDLGTEWDASRRERRVVDYMGSPSLIDPGCNLVLDLVTEAGCTTRYSCEGHPWGAYLGFDGPPVARDAVVALFRDAGWEVDDGPRAVVRMPGVDDVRSRDAAWRGVCEVLAAGIRPAAPGVG